MKGIFKMFLGRFLSALLHPWFWLLCLRTLGFLEKKQHAARARGLPTRGSLWDVALGVGLGMGLSLLLFALGFLWPGGPAPALAFLASALMGIVHPKFHCMIYGSSLLACFYPTEGTALLAFGALLHGAEGLLLLLRPGEKALWPVPLCLCMPYKMAGLPMPAWWTPGWPDTYTGGVRFGVFGGALGLRAEGLSGRERAGGAYLVGYCAALLFCLHMSPRYGPLWALVGHELPGVLRKIFQKPDGACVVQGAGRGSGFCRGDILVALDGSADLAPYLGGRPFCRAELLRRGRCVLLDFGAETDITALKLRFRGQNQEDMDGEALFYGSQQPPGLSMRVG